VTGIVHLVGAGPGAPGLITVRGLELIRHTDVVVYDRLVSPELIAEVPPRAEVLFVGKRPGRHDVPQEETNALLIDRARRGLDVVRLKGGDPFVFGRGGEEAEALAAAGIPFEIVPGVSSALAAPAAAGIPLTRRGIASSFAVATGHPAEPAGAVATGHPAGPEGGVDWDRLAPAVDTLVLLMAVGNLRGVCARMIEAGRAADTPAAVIRSATTPEQEVVVGTLADLADRAARLRPPAVVVVGPVVSAAVNAAVVSGADTALGSGAVSTARQRTMPLSSPPWPYASDQEPRTYAPGIADQDSAHACAHAEAYAHEWPDVLPDLRKDRAPSAARGAPR
jgi:uroporphyrin-III C-methyltransferase